MRISDNGSLTDKTACWKEQQAIRSDAISDIVSHRPDFLVRWGITIFFVLLLLLLFVCWMIQYPDTVNAHAKLTCLNAPKNIIAKTDGKLQKLYVSEGQQVQAGQMLGYMESIASPQEVTALSERLERSIVLLTAGRTDTVARLLDQPYLHLGELQAAYQQFVTARELFNDYLVNNFYSRKKAMLENDLHVLENVHQTLQGQSQLIHNDARLAEETYKMSQSLFDQKVISREEFRQQESKLLLKQQAIPQLQTSLLINQNQQRDKQKELSQLDHDMSQQRITFEQAVQTLKSALDDWQKKFLLVAPIAGRVTFSNFLQENQQLKAGDNICFISTGNSSYYAEMFIPQMNFGKVSANADVLLKFPSYPFEEYGIVKGKLVFVSHIPTDSGYLAKVALPSGLITNYNKPVIYRDGLVANAEIITRPMRLIDRFYYRLIDKVKR